MSTHVHNNPAGLQVRDLIAELQRYDPGDFTNIAAVKPTSTAASIEVVGKEKHDLDELRHAARSIQAAIADEERRYGKLVKRGEKAQAIMRRVAQQKKQRPLPLPRDPDPTEEFIAEMRIRCDGVLRKMVLGTALVCVVSVVAAYLYQNFIR